MFRHSGQGQIIAEVVAEIGAGVREGGVGGKAEAEGERILPGEFEPLDPAARSVRRLRHGPKPAAGLIVHENGDGFVDDEAVDLLPEQTGGTQPLIYEIMLEAEVELIGAEQTEVGVGARAFGVLEPTLRTEKRRSGKEWLCTVSSSGVAVT